MDLHKFLNKEPEISEVVYNGLNNDFTPLPETKARQFLSKIINHNLNKGYILHVGGNQWYKNRSGVIKIYDAWRSSKKIPVCQF
jgi:hypothetical protein